MEKLNFCVNPGETQHNLLHVSNGQWAKEIFSYQTITSWVEFGYALLHIMSRHLTSGVGAWGMVGDFYRFLFYRPPHLLNLCLTINYDVNSNL